MGRGMGSIGWVGEWVYWVGRGMGSIGWVGEWSLLGG